jgi:polyhydroxybutyrate depolymerase
MRRFWLLVSIPLLVLTVALSAQRPASDSLARQTWSIGGVERSALVAAPTSVVPQKGSPLVFVFHGHGGTSAHAARTFAIHQHWKEAVVIYAQGLPTRGLKTDPEGRRPGWQHAPGGEGDRDVKFVDAMLDWARARYRIDPARVYAAGHSNGGTFTYVLWAARGDDFAAFAPSASVFRRDLIAGARPKPAFIIVCEKDELVPPAAQRLSLSAVLRLNQARTPGDAWSAPHTALHPSPVGAHTVAYRHPGDHTLPANAGELMARFFKQH